MIFFKLNKYLFELNINIILLKLNLPPDTSQIRFISLPSLYGSRSFVLSRRLMSNITGLSGGTEKKNSINY